MNRRTLLACAFAVATFASFPAFADDAIIGNLTISGAFARSSPMVAQAGAGFLKITNSGEADALIAFKSDICEKPELHTHINDNGMMKMRAVEKIDVPANGEVELKPGGLHLMFVDLKERLQQGEMLDVTLVFEKAGEVTLKVPVKGPGAMHGG